LEREQAQRVKAIIEKVRVFRRFTIVEAQRMVKLCTYKNFSASELIYRIGEPSKEMLILLSGKLNVLNNEGTVLGEILPGTTTGEMGVLTGQPRSASILATEKSAGFVITKSDMDTFLRDETVRLKVFENMVDLFCERLTGANLQIENYAKRSRAI
jgi:CRP-like cAMP-binding protein